MKNEFTAILEPVEEGGYFAYCPEVPEANGQGGKKEEALDSLRGPKGKDARPLNCPSGTSVPISGIPCRRSRR